MRRFAFAVLLLFAVPLGAHAEYYISHDLGGKIRAYEYKYEQLNQSGERVVIDGDCLSACTLVLGMIPRKRICVTKRAVLGFHAAWIEGAVTGPSIPLPNPEGTAELWQIYPSSIRKWITARGGLTPTMQFMRWPEVARYYPQCP